jgi:hypothetical protein
VAFMSRQQHMTLGKMRSLGARCIELVCFGCRHRMTVNVDGWPDDDAVSSFETKFHCPRCGHVGARARPDFSKQNRD